MNTNTIEIELDEETTKHLEILARGNVPQCKTVKEVLEHLAFSAAEGVRREGAWEHEWVGQAFGYNWIDEPDPFALPTPTTSPLSKNG